METIRVLIIDDSVVVRRFVSDLVSAEPGLSTAGAAANGKIGIMKIEQDHPDLVVLDLEMPEMDGLETLVQIRRRWPLLPVIMYSSQTQRGARATLDALELGANDYVAKPKQTGSIEQATECVRGDLIPKIKALVQRDVPYRRGRMMGDERRAEPHGAAPVRPGASRPVYPIQVLAIGTSTGGPNALSVLLPTIPADFPVPIVIVQHMPPLFTGMLAERLDSKCALTVTEAKHGDLLVPGRAWIAPGDFHMVVVSGPGRPRIELNRNPHENSCRPSVDVLFRSVAQAYGGGTLAVVLTGMGADGLRGSESIAARGGTIFAQDEASSVVWGMPGFIARAGLAAKVLPIDSMAQAVLARVCNQRHAVQYT